MLQALLDMQLASMKAFNPPAFGSNTSLHVTTQRYALLTSSLLSLNADYQDGQLDHNIDRLRFAAMELLLRLSRRFPNKRAATIFMVNNFHHIVQARPVHLGACTLDTIPCHAAALCCNLNASCQGPIEGSSFITLEPVSPPACTALQLPAGGCQQRGPHGACSGDVPTPASSAFGRQWSRNH